MTDLQSGYLPEMPRMSPREYNQTSSPHAPLGIPGAPINVSVEQRISELSRAVTETADALAGARRDHQRASINRQQCEEAFIQASEALIAAIHDHREGTPTGAPYQP